MRKWSSMEQRISKIRVGWENWAKHGVVGDEVLKRLGERVD